MQLLERNKQKLERTTTSDNNARKILTFQRNN